MSSPSVNENDLDSPGYEFLRSHRNMMNLYHKLVALDYRRDFCPTYKCPAIHKLYFSTLSPNSFEQQYLFICLCAWLIKDKCQMNFELELEDIGSSIGVIFEALKLLHEDGDLDPKIHIRLEQGHGPEVVYAISCLADRALELAIEHDPRLGSVGPDIRFHNKQHDQTRTANSITIGQPIVGGTLTTRSLGKYFIEDSSLVLDYGAGSSKCESREAGATKETDPDEWLQQVERVAPQLVLDFNKEPSAFEDWQDQLLSIHHSKKSAQSFIDQSKSILQAVENRINRQLQVVSSREKFLQTNLRSKLEAFLQVWREHSKQTKHNKSLLDNVNGKTDLFESHITRLQLLGRDIEARIRELNDGSKLKELELIISMLDAQSEDLEVKVGLLLAAVCSKDGEQV